jgi:hypothetical protein|tara:strand:+ start:445 stop:750 length:306 start_codon:yes stop_codon:yes gene_type:complete
MKRVLSAINRYLSYIYSPFWKVIKWVGRFLKRAYYWLKYSIFPRYNLSVSYNSTWGDSDDESYIVKKFIKKQPNFIKFVTDDGELVEIRGADGLNYRIEEL